MFVHQYMCTKMKIKLVKVVFVSQLVAVLFGCLRTGWMEEVKKRSKMCWRVVVVVEGGATLSLSHLFPPLTQKGVSEGDLVWASAPLGSQWPD